VDDNERSNGYSPLEAAIYGNSFRALHLSAQSTGFRTHGFRHRSLSHANDLRIAEDFLINTRYLRYDRETETSIQSYFMDPGVTILSNLGREEKAGIAEIRIPEGVRLRRELGDVLARRRSSRSYTGDPIDLKFLATIIRSAGAVTGYGNVDLMSGGQATIRFRSAPSGGGLYPIDIYVASLKINGLERGLYRYDPLDDTLLQAGDRHDVDRLVGAFAIPEEIVSLSRANAIFALVGHPWRSMRKYGNRGLRFLFMEAGAIAENIHLATGALGFGSVDCASVHEDEAHTAMHIDGLYQTLLHTVLLGYPG